MRLGHYSVPRQQYEPTELVKREQFEPDHIAQKQKPLFRSEQIAKPRGCLNQAALKNESV